MNKFINKLTLLLEAWSTIWKEESTVDTNKNRPYRRGILMYGRPGLQPVGEAQTWGVSTAIYVGLKYMSPVWSFK